MPPVTDHQLTDLLHSGLRTLVYRGKQGGQSVVVKIFQSVSTDDLATVAARHQRELEIGERLAHVSGVVRPRALVHGANDELALVMDDAGTSLASLLREGRLPLRESLGVAARVATVLGHVHDAGVVHNDVNPSNIVVTPTLETTLIDFGLSFVVSKAGEGREPNGAVEGTLAYIAPEQTGRVARSVDHRADLYGLGATLYEMLAGRRPFDGADPLELIHGHLAKTPPPLGDAAPPVVARIVMKLLAKDPDARYQSAFGVSADLERCLASLAATGDVDGFELGARDVRNRLVLSGTLYGRDAELAALWSGFQFVAAGSTRLALVGGAAGVGKSTLVAELRRRALAEGAYAASGKFEQLKRDIPYTGFVTAFRQLAARLLSETPSLVEERGERLRAALGEDAPLVVGIVPELAPLLGVQPATARADAHGPSRAPRAFARFVGALASPDRPLLLLLDDLQWADGASLALVEAMLTYESVSGLYVIGTYRDAEVSAVHPMVLAQKALAASGVPVDTLPLAPLSEGDVGALLADTLQCDPGEAAPLARLVHAKTNGNPFFARAFLRGLHDEDLLRFDVGARRWRWDLAAVRAHHVTDNVVDLLEGKVAELGAAAGHVLAMAACLGAESGADSLAVAADLPPDEVRGALATLVDAGLMVCGADAEGAPTYRFAHDRIQQVAYAQIAAGDRVRVHQSLGRRMLEVTPAARRNPRIFELLHHLNFGMDAEPGTERPEAVAGLAAYNLTAARRAVAAAAHETALHHCEIGLRVSPPDAWKREYALTQQLHAEGALAASLAGKFSRMRELASALRARGRTPLDRVPAYEAEILAAWAQSRAHEAVDHCLAGLADLGLRLPRSPGRRTVLLELAWTLARVRRRSLPELTSLPRMTDARHLAVMRLFEICETPLFHASPPLFAILACRCVNLTLDQGAAPASLGAFVALAMLACSTYGARAYGNELADVAEALIARIGGPSRGQALGMLQYGVRHWKQPLRETFPRLLQAARDASEVGDLEHAALAPCFYGLHSIYAGVPLTGLLRECEEFGLAIRRMGQLPMLHFMGRVRQCILNLTGEGDTPWILVGEALDENLILSQFEADRNWMPFAAFLVEKIFLADVFGQVEVGLESLRRLHPHRRLLAGHFRVTMYHFHGALVRIAGAEGARGVGRQRLLFEARASLRKLELWAEDAPENYLHCARLVRAELARVLGDGRAATDAYEDAVRLARAHRFVNDEALAHERAARFHLSAGRATAGQAHLVEARRAWARWGAKAKVRLLEREFPSLLEWARASAGRSSTDESTPHSTRSTASSRGLSSRELDVYSAIKASQALSREILLPQVIAQLMRLSIENAGAERGALVLHRDGQLLVEAVHSLARAPLAGEPLPAKKSVDAWKDALPASIIRYVARACEALVLADASDDGRFSTDPYVREQRPRSVLAMPIVQQGALGGVLYLENNQNVGAFTPERVEVLGVLAAQAAISIDNANLYDRLSATSDSLREAVAAIDAQLRRIHLLNDFSLRAGALPSPEAVSSLILATLGALAPFGLALFLAFEGNHLVPHTLVSGRHREGRRVHDAAPPGIVPPARFEAAVFVRGGAPLQPWVARMLDYATRLLEEERGEPLPDDGAPLTLLVLPAFRKTRKLIGVFFAIDVGRPGVEKAVLTPSDGPFARLLQSHVETALETALVQTELRRQIGMRSEGLAEALARLSGTGRDEQRELTPGEVLNELYLVTGVLGKGAMGVVYDVRRLTDNKRLALKLLARPGANQLARFAREAQIISRVSHPNVISIVDVDVASAGFFYLAMEYVGGRALNEHAERYGDVPWALEVLRQIAEGLAAIHACGIVHRDLKPANILVSPDGATWRVKIADFGISKLVRLPRAPLRGDDPPPSGVSSIAPSHGAVGGDPDRSAVSLRPPPAAKQLTEDGLIIGTPKYMSPEALRDPETTPASDVFSFGVLACELLAGSYPFPESVSVFVLHGERIPPPALRAWEGADPALRALLHQCLSEHPEARPTARHIADALALR